MAHESGVDGPSAAGYPVPVNDRGERRVYLSVGHQQMMTDPLKPLGLSLWQMIALPVMHEAGGRLFVDARPRLASPAGAAFVAMIGRADPLTGDALQTLLDRGDIAAPGPDAAAPTGPPPAGAPPPPIETDPAIVDGLIARNQASVARLAREIGTVSGEAALELIRRDIAELKQLLADPLSMQVIMAAMEATWWLNDHLLEWLAETNAADVLTRSVPDNVTSEMGLALLDVADAVRPHPVVVAYLERAQDDDSVLDGLGGLDGGPEARAAIEAYLDDYGARCVGEIDITRPRWRERPAALVPAILGNVRNVGPGEALRRFEQGLQEATTRQAELLARLRALPDGESKAAETERMIDRVRTFSGYREYPKFGIVRRMFLYKQALLAETEGLVDDGALRDVDDAFFLTFTELQDAVRTRRVDDDLVARRKEVHTADLALTPPRVLTSDGEALTGIYRREVPGAALVGVAASAGTVEGRARVILDIDDSDLERGDILVTAFTDPSWTPLFVGIDGLVTEVGGAMTHGAVIAREYGLPAVVGVPHATRLIRDGQRIRVNGTDGYVELLG